MAKSQIEGIIEALVSAANDKEEEAQRAIFTAVVDIARRKHIIVLNMCHTFLNKHTKLSRSHRVVLLRLMEKVTKEHINSIDTDLAYKMIRLGSAELTQTQEVIPEWQTAASNLLSTLGRRYAKEVMQELLTKFQTGVQPHFFVVQTFGQLATSNVEQVVPLLKQVLAKMLPMLGAAKVENMQWVFSNAIARFCEAIGDYLADEQRASASGITSIQFEGEVFSAYDQLFNLWLGSKEARLRLAVVEAIGYAVNLLSPESLNEQLPRLIPGVTQLYRKHAEHYYITQCLCMIMEAASKKECVQLVAILDSLLSLLHQQMCAAATGPNNFKNHNEILRCYAVACKAYSHRVVSFLLSKLELNQDRIKAPTLEIMKHLFNSCDEELEDMKPLILSGMKILLNEQTLKVRQVFGQVIITMAHHDYLGLEGGSSLVEFVVRQCSLNPDDKALAKLSTEGIKPGSVKTMSENVLRLITTTIPNMETVLWPYLLEFLVPVEYTRSLSIVCRCVSHIAEKKREQRDEDYLINFVEYVNLPKPQAIIARLLVLLGNPQSTGSRAEYALHCLQSLSPLLQEDLADLWDIVIPKLLTYLKEHSGRDGKWDQKHWEDLTLKFLSRSVDDVNDEDWLIELGNVLGDKEYIEKTYTHFPEEKGFLYKCLGVLMRKSHHKQFVNSHLEMMFATIRHSSQAEREGCAIGVGFCAASHLDLVVEKLEAISKQDLVKKSKGFFSFGKDKSDVDIERIKATVLLCYGYVCFHSPPHLITSRLEVSILRVINPHFGKVKDTTVKQNLIRTIDLIGKSVHPDHLRSVEFTFSRRGDLINHLLAYIKAEPPTFPMMTETRSLSMSALSTLVKLNPRLSDADQFDAIKVSIDSVLPVPPLSPNTKRKEVTVTPEESASYLEGAIQELQNLLTTVLSREVSSANLDSILKHLDPWYRSTDPSERVRAMNCLLVLMRAYWTHAATNEAARQLPLQAILFGRMVPRCSDPVTGVRQNAIEIIQLTLRIACSIPGEEDQLIDALDLLRSRAENDDPNALFSLCNDLSKVLCKKVAGEFLWPTIETLLEGLVDYQPHSSSGACVVLNNIVKLRGSVLSEQVPNLIDGLYQQLGSISNAQTRTGTLRCLRTLCTQYLEPTITHMLSMPLPWDSNLIELWQVLTGDVKLMKSVLVHLLEVISLTLPYQEKAKGSVMTRVETAIPKAATHAIGILCLKLEEGQEVTQHLFPKLFSILLLRVGVSAAIGMGDKKTTAPSCSSVAIDALKNFLFHTNSGAMVDFLEQQNAWTLMEKEDTCPHGCLHVARALVNCHPDLVDKTVACLTSSLTSLYEPHRVTVVSFYSEIISTLSESKLQLAEQIMNNLLGRQVDQSYVVRMYCIRGLGNMADIGGSKVSQFSTTVLSAMLAGMDDREDPMELITMEAMNGLSRIFEKIDEGHVRPILINIALRIRPCFEKPAPAVRAAAINLFGSLSRFGNGPSEGPFLEQIQTNFVTLLVHLNESDPVVVAACKTALRKLGPLMKCERVNKMFQKHLTVEDSLLFADFLNDLCKMLVTDFTDKVNFYVMSAVSFFKSMWPDVKSSAALFVGYMMGHLPKSKAGIISKEHVCEALVMLLRDPTASVRSSAAEAMSLLYDY